MPPTLRPGAGAGSDHDANAMIAGAAAVSADKSLEVDRLRRAVLVEHARGYDLDERHRHDRDAAVRRPGVAHEPPGLRDQRAAGLRLDMAAGAGNQRGDHRVVVIVRDAQVCFRLGERDRLDRGRRDEDGGHADASI